MIFFPHGFNLEILNLDMIFFLMLFWIMTGMSLLTSTTKTRMQEAECFERFSWPSSLIDCDKTLAALVTYVHTAIIKKFNTFSIIYKFSTGLFSILQIRARKRIRGFYVLDVTYTEGKNPLQLSMHDTKVAKVSFRAVFSVKETSDLEFNSISDTTHQLLFPTFLSTTVTKEKA